ncbi:MAG: extracellular solute-binding protein [Spirochaetales bacterium]|nr:extracellular solute-binding protein [Spirochaetales bacterium]
MKKIVCTALLIVAAASMLFAQGSNESATASTEQRVVTTVCRASYANEEWYNRMNADFEAETGIHVDVQPTPGNDDDHDAKVNIDLLAGRTIDVIPSLGPKFYYERVEAGFFAPLSELAAAAGVDVNSVYGGYLPADESGEFYSVPVKQELWCVFFNRNLFDAAGVPYPEGPWTWDEYVETAKKLTDPSKGIYGSHMSIDPPWTIMLAKQEEIPLYKEDGTCNFDDPRWREAIEFYATLGNELKVQMSVEEFKNENASWNYYALAGDHIAMFPNGNWFTRLLNSQTDYPKDWSYGVAPMPSTGNENGANNLVSMGYVSVNKNAAHPEEALEYVLWLGENQWKYEGGIPALATLSEEDKNLAFSSVADASNGQVTVDEIYNAWINTGLGTTESDIIGTAAGEYDNIVEDELEAYFLGLQSIDVTIDNVVNRVNEAIKNVQ